MGDAQQDGAHMGAQELGHPDGHIDDTSCLLFAIPE